MSENAPMPSPPPQSAPPALQACQETPSSPPRRRIRISDQYERDHQNPINHFLHVFVGWPICAFGVLALPFRPLWCLYAFVLGYAFMWTGHFVFEGNTPTVFKHPTTPLVMAWDVIRRLVRGAGRLVGLAGPR